jgi:hypothetical protein
LAEQKSLSPPPDEDEDEDEDEDDDDDDDQIQSNIPIKFPLYPASIIPVEFARRKGVFDKLDLGCV